MSDAQDAVAQAQAALAAAQEAAAQEAAQAKAAQDSPAAQAAEVSLGKAIGGYVGNLIRRVEALEGQVFGHSQSPAAPAESAREMAADPQPESPAESAPEVEQASEAPAE